MINKENVNRCAYSISNSTKRKKLIIFYFSLRGFVSKDIKWCFNNRFLFNLSKKHQLPCLILLNQFIIQHEQVLNCCNVFNRRFVIQSVSLWLRSHIDTLFFLTQIFHLEIRVKISYKLKVRGSDLVDRIFKIFQSTILPTLNKPTSILYWYNLLKIAFVRHSHNVLSSYILQTIAVSMLRLKQGVANSFRSTLVEC